MSRVLGGFLVLELGLTTAAAQEPPATPAEQYRALVDAQESASSPGRVLTDVERLAFIGRTFRRWNEIARKLIELAERYPKDPIAADALIRAAWQVNTTPWPIELVGPDDARAGALSLLRRDHIRSDKLGALREHVASGLAEEYEPFLRDVLAKNPNREIQARACLSSAHFLINRLDRVDLTLNDSKLAAEFAGLYREDYLARLRRQNREDVIREAEALLERTAREYGDVKLDGGSVADKAREKLHGIRELAVGKPAPEIEGTDQEGKRFKLGDYRGKVVLLDFWSEY